MKFMTTKPIYFVTIVYMSGERKSVFYTDNKEKCESYKRLTQEIVRGNEDVVIDVLLEEKTLACYGEGE